MRPAQGLGGGRLSPFETALQATSCNFIGALYKVLSASRLLLSILRLRNWKQRPHTSGLVSYGRVSERVDFPLLFFGAIFLFHRFALTAAYQSLYAQQNTSKCRKFIFEVRFASVQLLAIIVDTRAQFTSASTRRSLGGGAKRPIQVEMKNAPRSARGPRRAAPSRHFHWKFVPASCQL